MQKTKQQTGLEGKKIILLGGSSGLGLATAKAAAAEGAEILICSGNRQKLDQALMELPQSARGEVLNLREEQDIKIFFDSAGAFDHLVYTAGENLNLNAIAHTEIAKAKDAFTIRYWGVFAAIKYATPFIQSGGSINLISGTANARPGSGWSVASSICGAVEGLVRAMAVELAPIRVNSVVPGVIDTNLWNNMTEENRAGLYSAMEKTLLLKRVGKAEDVALAFIYLMKQGFGTGQNLVVDGGTMLV